MTVQFLQPPPVQREGGLDAAIEGLRQALPDAGVTVLDGENLSASAEVVHFHGIWQPGHLKVSRACRRSSIPYVVSPHGMLEPWAWRHKWWKKWPYFHAVEKRRLRDSSLVLATAETEAARLRGMLGGTKVQTLPLGMTGTAGPNHAEARQKLGWAEDELVLLYLSRIHPKKGLDMLLKALPESGYPPDTRLVIVGGGDAGYMDELKSLATRLAARLPRIDWIGEVWGEGRWLYFQGSDLFCLPTHSENFGLAVLEACQAGTPALTTNATPWGGWLGDGRGFIADPDQASLRLQLNEFFAQGPRTFGARDDLARWAAENFSWDRLAKQYAEMYRTLVRER